MQGQLRTMAPRLWTRLTWLLPNHLQRMRLPARHLLLRSQAPMPLTPQRPLLQPQQNRHHQLPHQPATKRWHTRAKRRRVLSRAHQL